MYWDYCYYSLAAAALQLTACSGYRNENYSSKIKVEAIYGEISIKRSVMIRGSVVIWTGNQREAERERREITCTCISAIDL